VGVLAIDPGEKKSGFASADALRISRQPLGMLRHDGDEERLFDHVASLLAERVVSTLVVGLPLGPDGERGERARAVEAFVERLRARFPEQTVCTHDERLTTKEAEGRLREAGRRGREIAREKDGWAALVLLEDWIASGEPRSAPEGPS